MEIIDLVESKIECEHFRSINEVDSRRWDAVVPRATGLKHAVLKVFETSGINDLCCHYLLFNKGEKLVGKANLYEVSMDFMSIDQGMSSNAKKIIKSWHPNFLNLSMIECGLFAMNGDGLVAGNELNLADIVKQVDSKLHLIAKEKKLDLLVYRDVPLEHFTTYEKLLVPLGYMPVVGFTNAVIDIEWGTFADYLSSINSKDRYKLKKSLKIEKEFDIRVEITSDYKHLAKEMARLWANVNAASGDYNREQLDEAFFYQSGLHLTGLSEVILFYSKDNLIAFMWNLVGDEDYHMADWGVDYDFPDFKAANLYRAASVYSLRRAIELGKRRMQLGMTNYAPKKLLGAKMQPLAFFIKHRSNPEYSRIVSRMITDALEHPEVLNYYSASAWPVAAMTPDEFKNDITQKVLEFEAQDVFSKVEANYEIDILKLGGLYSFYPDTDVVDVSLSGPSFFSPAKNSAVTAAGISSLQANGAITEGPPFFAGCSSLTVTLEEKIAKFFEKESAQLFPTGSLVHGAILGALLDADTVVFMDEQNGPLLWEAVTGTGCQLQVYNHNSAEHLEALLSEHPDRKKIIITEAIFPLFGDCCDLNRIVELKQKYNARLYLDESLALGLFADNGAGLSAAKGLSKQVDIIAGSTLSGLGVDAGFFATHKRVAEHARHVSTAFLFSPGLSFASRAMLNFALDELFLSTDIRSDLLWKTDFLKNQLEALNFSVVNHGVPIINVMMNDFMILLAVQKKLLKAGIATSAIGQPMLPPEFCVLRMSLHSAITFHQLNYVIEQFREISQMLFSE